MYLILSFQLLDVIEPDTEGHGWMAKTKPEVTSISGYEFNFLVIATGRQVRTDRFEKITNFYSISTFPN